MAEIGGPGRQEGDGVIAVERALSILDAFTERDRSLALTELSRRTGLLKSTVLRLAKSLARGGYLIRNEDASWRLGPKLVRLGMYYQAGFRATDVIEPFLAGLSRETGESAAFYVREGDVRICLLRVDSPQAIGHRARVGDMLPLDRGAPGRVLLAFSGEPGELYDEVRARGHHVTLGERDPQVSSIACPIFQVGQKLFGALAVIGPTNRFDEPTVARHLTALRSAAADLTARLGGRAAFPDLPSRPQAAS